MTPLAGLIFRAVIQVYIQLAIDVCGLIIYAVKWIWKRSQS
jgi:hypothetical protein